MEVRFASDVPGVWPAPKIQSDVAGPGKPKKSEVPGGARGGGMVPEQFEWHINSAPYLLN